MQKRSVHRAIWCLVIVQLAWGLNVASRAAFGDSFFNLSATGMNGTTASANGSNILNLTDNLINHQQAFAPLLGQNFTGTVRYGGIPNALVFSENAAQTQATLTIPSTGFTKTFNGTNSADLQKQVRDFIKTDGQQQYAKFVESVDRQSKVAAIDGNPQASTAYISTDAFRRFGFGSTLSAAPREPGDAFQFRVDGGGGATRTQGFNGNFADLTLAATWRFTDNIALSLATTALYRNVENSQAYTVAQTLGLPITILPLRNSQGISWQITPWAFGALAASYDQAAGTVLVGGGGTSNVTYKMGDLTFTLADQGSYTGDTKTTVDGYGFDVTVNQWIIKNGGRITYQPHGGSFFVDAGITYSNLLHNASVPSYWTPSTGVGLKFNQNSGIRVGFEGDFAPGYTTLGGVATFFLSF
ncbi:MAG: hypothetical protein M3O30_15740 [Planctomycetota bacterium]|nr:hypothetical protein [Planctomycetota bacterium]